MPGPSGWMRPFACVVTLATFCAGLFLLFREHSSSTILFLGVILVVPALLAVISGMEWIYLRHFIIGVAFTLLLFAYLLGRLWNNGRLGKAVSLALVAIYCAANTVPLVQLFKDGHGHYREAMRFIADHSTSQTVTVGGDHDFRIPTVLKFYADETMGGKLVQYYLREAWPRQGPEWVICHKESLDDPAPIGTLFTDGPGNRYALMKTFPTAPVSGLHWYLFQNLGP
jgi:hypothetical protein